MGIVRPATSDGAGFLHGAPRDRALRVGDAEGAAVGSQGGRERRRLRQGR